MAQLQQLHKKQHGGSKAASSHSSTNSLLGADRGSQPTKAQLTMPAALQAQARMNAAQAKASANGGMQLGNGPNAFPVSPAHWQVCEAFSHLRRL